MESILDVNNSVALFGTTLSKYKINLLLQLQIENFQICIDCQYKRWYNEDDGTEDAKEFFQWHKIIDKMVDDLKPYGNVEVIYDDGDLLDYKQSPSDRKEVWDELYERRWKI